MQIVIGKFTIDPTTLMDDDFYIGGPRDYDEQTDAFRFDLDDLVYRYIDEFDINTFEFIIAIAEPKVKKQIYNDINSVAVNT